MQKAKGDSEPQTVFLSHLVGSATDKQTAEWHVMSLTRHVSQGRGMEPGSSHRWDCPLAENNEIILGEVMLKMNHLLSIPQWPGVHISPGPCAQSPSILLQSTGLSHQWSSPTTTTASDNTNTSSQRKSVNAKCEILNLRHHALFSVYPVGLPYGYV